jgi:hypothetical protein
MLVPMTVRKIDRLYERRILPRAEEEQFTYEMVRFHLEDLNALAERTMGQPKRQRDSARTVTRVAAIVQAARWNHAGFVGAIRRFVREGRAEGIDAFGPTLLLLALEPGQTPSLRETSAPILALASSLLARIDIGRPGRPSEKASR